MTGSEAEAERVQGDAAGGGGLARSETGGKPARADRVVPLLSRRKLIDEHKYDEWLSLWTKDCLYWVPCNSDDADPARQAMIIYDDPRGWKSESFV